MDINGLVMKVIAGYIDQNDQNDQTGPKSAKSPSKKEGALSEDEQQLLKDGAAGVADVGKKLEKAGAQILKNSQESGKKMQAAAAATANKVSGNKDAAEKKPQQKSQLAQKGAQTAQAMQQASAQKMTI